MMEGTGTLEGQLGAIRLKAHEVAMRAVEDLGTILEEQRIQV